MWSFQRQTLDSPPPPLFLIFVNEIANATVTTSKLYANGIYCLKISNHSKLLEKNI